MKIINTMNKIKEFPVIKLVMFVSLFIILYSCSDTLDYQPKGVVTEADLQGPEGAELLATAAYAQLGNSDWAFASHTTNWLYGSVRSDDAYKGGGSTADQGGMDRYERFRFILNDQGEQHNVWIAFYEAISRANRALALINTIDEADYPLKVERQAEMRFLRAHNYFRLVMFYKNVPWIDENVENDEIPSISNREFTQDELWDMIAEDFQFGVDNLPMEQNQVGRASAVSAAAYLARTRLFQAYEQDDMHNVVNINESRLEEVVQHTDFVINSQKHSLSNDYAENFLAEFDNGPESVFAIQHSQDDGTEEGRLNFEHGLNYNMAPGYGCCWFHVPSHNLVNAFQTNDEGIPLFDSFNDDMISAPEDYLENNFDPRLSHTVGIPGHPFKYDSEFIYSDSWARATEIYGHHSTMKEVQHPESSALRPFGPFFGSTKNVDIIRYSEVLLMKAEALIELGREDEALPYINMIRERAANSTDRVLNADGSEPASYNIDKYQPGINITWNQENAREALRWERRLEYAMESWRFFDLVRWGIAAETLNNYFEVERTRRSFLDDAIFEKNRNEYLPIPQQEINLSEGLYEQNPGY